MKRVIKEQYVTEKDTYTDRDLQKMIDQISGDGILNEAFFDGLEGRGKQDVDAIRRVIRSGSPKLFETLDSAVCNIFIETYLDAVASLHTEIN